MTQHEFIIGKKWQKTSATLPVINPYTQEAFAEVSLANPEALEQAIRLAESAYAKTRNLSSMERRDICNQIARGLEANQEEFAQTISKESGKPLVFARGEVARSISTFSIAAEEASRIHGEVLNLDITQPSLDKLGITRRFPIGPVSGISPFNFPLNLVAHKVAPALAVGNPIILKPASATPLTALLLGKIIMESDAPEGEALLAELSRGS